MVVWLEGWLDGMWRDREEEYEFPLIHRETCLSDIDRRSFMLRLCHPVN